MSKIHRNICLCEAWVLDFFLNRLKKENQSNSKQDIHSGYFWRKGVKEDRGGKGEGRRGKDK